MLFGKGGILVEADIKFGPLMHSMKRTYAHSSHVIVARGPEGGAEIGNGGMTRDFGRNTYSDPSARTQHTEILVLLSRLAPLMRVAGSSARMRSDTIPMRTAK